jgi:hypothetical protein
MINAGSSQDLCALCFVLKKKKDAPFWSLKNRGVTASHKVKSGSGLKPFLLLVAFRCL